MPKRNALKQYGANQFYHVYNRGVAKMDIFREDNDYVYMLSLFKKYLTSEPQVDTKGRQLPNYSDRVELVAFCLMPNHYHLLFLMLSDDGLAELMRSVMTAYSMYFNRKYKRVGGLFESRFLASRVTSDEYLWHVSRYIHLNPRDIAKGYKHYAYSSINYYRGDWFADWLHEENLVDSKDERQEYQMFVQDGAQLHDIYHRLRYELANTDDS